MALRPLSRQTWKMSGDEWCDSDGEVIATTRWRETCRLRALQAHFQGFQGDLPSGSCVLYGGYATEPCGKGGRADIEGKGTGKSERS